MATSWTSSWTPQKMQALCLAGAVTSHVSIGNERKQFVQVIITCEKTMLAGEIRAQY